MIDVIILSWAKEHSFKYLTECCIASLRTSSDKDIFNIIVVETNPNVFYDNVITVHLNESFNYNRFANQGIQIGWNDYVCICNNDLEFKKGWAEELLQYKYESMSPISYTSKTQDKFRKYKVVKGYNVAEHLSGWCIFMPRKTWSKIGGLCEDFSFWFSDNAYIEQLKALKIQHYLICTSIVNHIDEGSKTIHTVDHKQKQEFTYNQATLFNRKHGTDHFGMK